MGQFPNGRLQLSLHIWAAQPKRISSGTKLDLPVDSGYLSITLCAFSECPFACKMEGNCCFSNWVNPDH